jgi:hypothetical protein
MNTDRLAKMYDTLTAQERLSLLLAAEKRGYTHNMSDIPHPFFRLPVIQGTAPVRILRLPVG